MMYAIIHADIDGPVQNVWLRPTLGEAIVKAKELADAITVSGRDEVDQFDELFWIGWLEEITVKKVEE